MLIYVLLVSDTEVHAVSTGCPSDLSVPVLLTSMLTVLPTDES